jgi:hypothetical protein
MSGADRTVFLTGRRALLLFLLVLLLRVAIAAQFQGNFDSQSFVYAADAAVHGENVYRATPRYNYSPLWAYVLGGLWLLARPNTSLFVLLVGLLQVAVDVGTAFLVLRIAERRLGFPPDAARRAALLFFSNPVSVLVSGAQGQFDGTAVLCLLAALFAATAPSGSRDPNRVAGFLALANLVKHATAFHPLLFWKRVRPGGLSDSRFAAPYVAFLLSFLPFAAAANEILRNVFLYSAGVERGAARPGGLAHFLAPAGGSAPVLAAVFAAAVVGIVRATRNTDLVRASLVLFLGLLVFLPSYGPQYLVWPVALASFFPSAFLGFYTAAGALWHSSESLQLAWPVRVDPYFAWVVALVWFTREMSEIRGSSRSARA